ncbi:MAG TPA: hypothetical protein VK581_13965 [Chthoniobacterales bacterium]|nr:hypothetical protein [Chthoniobacterales bacterium]
MLAILFFAALFGTGYIYFTRPDGSSELRFVSPVTVTFDVQKRQAHASIHRISNDGGKSGSMSLELWSLQNDLGEIKVGEATVGKDLRKGYYLEDISANIPISKVPETNKAQALALRLRETYRDERFRSQSRVSDSYALTTRYVFNDNEWIRWWERKKTWTNIALVVVTILCAIFSVTLGRFIQRRRLAKIREEPPTA